MTKCTLSIPDLGKWVENEKTKRFYPIWKKFKKVSSVDESYFNLIESLNSDLVAPVESCAREILINSYLSHMRGRPYIYYSRVTVCPASLSNRSMHIVLYFRFDGLPIFKNLTKIEVGRNSSDLENIGISTRAVKEEIESSVYLKYLRTDKLYTDGGSILDLPGQLTVMRWKELTKEIIMKDDKFKVKKI
jgi:hypothetical protein